MYTVKDISGILGLTEHTVRYYTDIGLVPNMKRDKNNIRVFDEEAVNWLTGVKYLKQCGMSIEDIKGYVNLCLAGEDTIQERYEIILRYEAIAKAQLEEAKERLNYMSKKASHYLDIVNKVIPDDTNPGTWQG